MATRSSPGLSIWHCETDEQDPDADPPSWLESVARIPKPTEERISKVKAQMVARQRRLEAGEQLRSPDHFRTEGELPDGKHFYAIKVGDIRAYGWFSRKHKRVFIISHYKYKDSDKLDPVDTARVVANWRNVEER